MLLPARPLLPALLALALLPASGCQSGGGGLSFVPGVGPTWPEPPPTVRAQTGKGRLQVYGASLYSPGQKIYKELRQRESLMAFLACQGEPDHVEVVAHPGAPKIHLYYSRRGLDARGRVEIVPSEAGFYAAHPIDPEGRDATPPPPRPKPEPEPPQPGPAPEPAPEPEPRAEPPPEPEAPTPTPQQRDDCPIEPWRPDCRELCTGDDPPWDWCDYPE